MLIRRLAHRLPTVFQINHEAPYLFYEGGVKKFEQIDLTSNYSALKSAPGEPLDRIWALVDYSRELSEPAAVFKKGVFFTVETAPPRSDRHDWTRKVPFRYFYMSPWSFVEVIQA